MSNDVAAEGRQRDPKATQHNINFFSLVDGFIETFAGFAGAFRILVLRFLCSLISEGFAGTINQKIQTYSYAWEPIQPVAVGVIILNLLVALRCAGSTIDDWNFKWNPTRPEFVSVVTFTLVLGLQIMFGQSKREPSLPPTNPIGH